MPLFGSHLSAAGGLHNAPLAAARYGFDSVQLFTKAPGQWAGKPISDEQATLFRDTVVSSGVRFPMVHDSYLINLASQEEILWRKSLEAFIDEIERADKIGAAYLVTHPGAHLGAGEDVGLAKVVEALDEVHRRTANCGVGILLETTAGQGTCLGHRFEHLAEILGRVASPERLGICFDTCHVFAAGYPLAPQAKYRTTMREFDRIIGLHRIKAFHLNDSKKPQGSRVDRHAHIGRGCLGLEPFRLLVNDRRFRGLPMILETAKEIDAEHGDMDTVNLTTLRSLLR